MIKKALLLTGIATVVFAVPAQAQIGGREAAAKAVLEATDQFARDYGAGTAPRTALLGGALTHPLILRRQFSG